MEGEIHAGRPRGGIANARNRLARFEPGSSPATFLSGFTFIVAIDFDDQGNLYVLQHLDGPGAPQTGSLIRVAPDASRTTVISGLTRATAVQVGPHGAIYISHRGTSAGTGEVLRIQP